MKDYRPEISRVLREAKSHGREVWLTWPNPPLRLKVKAANESTATDGAKVIFVANGRFGLGIFVTKDGPRVVDPTFVGGRSSRGSLRVHGDEIRAEVLEDHPLVAAPACKACVHYGKGGATSLLGGACFHPSKDGPASVADASVKPYWCPGFESR